MRWTVADVTGELAEASGFTWIDYVFVYHRRSGASGRRVVYPEGVLGGTEVDDRVSRRGILGRVKQIHRMGGRPAISESFIEAHSSSPRTVSCFLALSRYVSQTLSSDVQILLTPTWPNRTPGGGPCRWA
jgi:hypothetical protein